MAEEERGKSFNLRKKRIPLRGRGYGNKDIQELL